MDKVKEFKSFYKTVVGNEGEKCNYPTRLDTYGCGCAHDCKYCYAKSLLYFRKQWDAGNPSVADIDKIKKRVAKIPSDTQAIRLGGMTDCFQPMEKKHRVTYRTIGEFNKRGIPYLIVTKSAMVADKEYIRTFEKDLAHIQITLTTTDDYFSTTYERASIPSERIRAIETLYEQGFDVQVRLSPFIPQFVNLDIINNINCNKILVEFLRVNSWIKSWFDIDYSEYTVFQNGYYHLPLEKKIEYMKGITGFEQVSVCEDETEAYEYWKNNVNYNKDDCCNLRVTNK